MGNDSKKIKNKNDNSDNEIENKKKGRSQIKGNLFKHLNAIRPKGRPPTDITTSNSNNSNTITSLSGYNNKKFIKHENKQKTNNEFDNDNDSATNSDGDDSLKDE